jgi:flagellar basal-body rod protein FlgF
MDVGLIAGSHQMQMLEGWQSTVANNLANASTPGFQKSLFAISADGAEELDAPVAEKVDSTALTLPAGHRSNSFVDGSIRVTGNPHDFAIRHGGFFAVTTPTGETLYTKDGEFQMNAEGVLVNKAGYTVDVEGGQLSVDLQLGPITVTRDGSVNQQGQSLGRISAYSFDEPENLVRRSGSYFVDRGAAGSSLMEDPIVLQGHLMGSSISAMAEMVSMIQISRAYEMSQKIIQESDERLDRAIQTFSV